MAVKKVDRKLARLEPLYKARDLFNYILTLTHPAEYNKDGKRTRRSGILGEGQPLQVFGYDIITCGKKIHANCYEASEIRLKNKETLGEKNKYYKEAIKYCDCILRLVDLCIAQYAQENKRKFKSFMHLAELTKISKDSIKERMNKDKLIYEQQYLNK